MKKFKSRRYLVRRFSGRGVSVVMAALLVVGLMAPALAMAAVPRAAKPKVDQVFKRFVIECPYYLTNFVGISWLVKEINSRYG